MSVIPTTGDVASLAKNPSFYATMLSTVAREIYCQPPSFPDIKLGISLPGGIDIGFDPSMFGSFPDLGDIAGIALGGINLAMAPIMPLFKLLEVVMKIFDCIKAIPDAIASLNPKKIVDCLGELGILIGSIAAMLPPLTIPKLIIQILDSIIVFLLSIRYQLFMMIRIRAKIALVDNKARATNNPHLARVVDCATRNVETQGAFIAAKADPLNRMLKLVSQFLSLIGLDLGLDCISIPIDIKIGLTPIDVVLFLLLKVRGLVLGVPFLAFNSQKPICPIERSEASFDIESDIETTAEYIAYQEAHFAAERYRKMHAGGIHAYDYENVMNKERTTRGALNAKMASMSAERMQAMSDDANATTDRIENSLGGFDLRTIGLDFRSV